MRVMDNALGDIGKKFADLPVDGQDESLIFDLFPNEQLNPLITNTRTSVLRTYNADGNLSSNAATKPAVDHNPLTGKRRGLIGFNGSTNNISRNSEMTGSMSSHANLTCTIASTTLPDGTTGDAWQVVNTVVGAPPTTHWYAPPSSNVTLSAANVKFSYSFFIEAFGDLDMSDEIVWRYRFNGWTDICGVEVNLKDETVAKSLTGAGTVGQVSIEKIKDGLYHVKVNDCESVGGYTDATIECIVRSDGDGTSGHRFWGWQFEEGKQVSPPIITTGSAASSTDDHLAFHEFRDKLKPPFVVYAEFGMHYEDDDVHTIFECRSSANNSSNQIQLYNYHSNMRITSVVAGNYDTSIYDGIELPMQQFNRIVAVFDENKVALYVNGVKKGEDNTTGIVDLYYLYLLNPSWDGWQSSGWLRDFKIYKGDKSDEWCIARSTSVQTGLGDNLLTGNSHDFENGVGGWYSSGGGTVSADSTTAASGSQSLKIENVDGYDRAEIDLTVEKGQMYQFDCMYKSDKDALQRFAAWVGATIPEYELDSTEWTDLSFKFMAEDTSLKIRAYARQGSGNDSDVLWLDDVKVRKVLYDNSI